MTHHFAGMGHEAYTALTAATVLSEALAEEQPVASAGRGSSTAASGAVSVSEQTHNADVVVGYSLWGPAINAVLNVQQASAYVGAKDSRPMLCLNVAPPSPEYAQTFARSVVFLVRAGLQCG